MKNLASLLIAVLFAGALTGQTMKWIPLNPGQSLGNCQSMATVSNKYRCYTLQYIPAVSGTLTSYTTGFFVSCTSKGSAIAFNQSCSMNNNVNMIDGCGDFGKVLMNSSGNTGGPGSDQVMAGRPVYLHEVCFTIPAGEEISVIEDDLTDLTTSIDLGNGQVVTEMPTYITQTIGKPRIDPSIPAYWLDFVAKPVDGHQSQLDWTLNSDKKHVKYVIEHSVDGNNFNPVGEVTAEQVQNAIESYQFMDKPEGDGIHFYRLKAFDERGGYDYSPIRLVNFSPGEFVMKAWPSPVSESLNVFISHASEAGHMELLDPAGKKVAEQDFADGDSNHEMNVYGMPAGMYTVVAVSGSQRLNEKVVVVR